ncbi:hypothetical protein NC653_032249 [Populus alba x Populus x berolinensis]|uniref:Uncharacterized protein n=1 Tax=Populus alba x Populus x berolinensis TaxID=444605 RepID=A0AAD6LQX4_9ROSI|nr:hypothetical protein NC653_032249 [Populus alba x Populus x berolinensis]
MGSMKVHQLARGFWEHEPSLTLGCKRLRPLAPKLANTDHSVTSFDLKSFIRPDSGPRKLASSDEKKDSPQGEVEKDEDSPYKRKCKSWSFECFELEESRSCKEEGDRTLELFPLHPEGR